MFMKKKTTLSRLVKTALYVTLQKKNPGFYMWSHKIENVPKLTWKLCAKHVFQVCHNI